MHSKIVLFMLFIFSSANASQWGPGATTLTCIDWDSDGYGVGPGCAGADGDDSDPNVRSGAEIIEKYAGGVSSSGGLSVFLAAKKGYSPKNYYWVATTGDNNTAKANDPNNPWATIQGLRADHTLVAGDIVIIREGTYTDNWSLAYPTTSGSSGHPVIFMAYPGEKPIWDLVGDFSGDATNGNDYLVFDGLLFTNSATQLGRTFFFGGDAGTTSTGITIRNCEVWDRANGVFAMQDLHSWIIEKNVIHHTDGAGSSHSIYLGARGYPNDDIIIRNNLLYNTGLTCAQMNGRCTKYIVSGNVCYNYKNASGFSLEMGVTGAHLYNNIIFNGTRTPIAIYNYPPPDQSIYPKILPGNMTDNLIEHNTIIVPNRIYYNGVKNGINHNITISNETPRQVENIFKNTFRNNLLINFSGGHAFHIQTKQVTYTPLSNQCSGGMDFIDERTKHLMYRSNGADPTELIKDATIENNILYNNKTSNVMDITNIAKACNTPITSSHNATSKIFNWLNFSLHSNKYSGNINRDPMLSNISPNHYTTPHLWDYRPMVTSPAIRAGTLTAVNTDIEGNERDSSSPSIGAFEYVLKPSAKKAF